MIRIRPDVLAKMWTENINLTRVHFAQTVQGTHKKHHIYLTCSSFPEVGRNYSVEWFDDSECWIGKSAGSTVTYCEVLILTSVCRYRGNTRTKCKLVGVPAKTRSEHFRLQTRRFTSRSNSRESSTREKINKLTSYENINIIIFYPSQAMWKYSLLIVHHLQSITFKFQYKQK
jgi:hypothetical protein